MRRDQEIRREEKQGTGCFETHRYIGEPVNITSLYTTHLSILAPYFREEAGYCWGTTEEKSYLVAELSLFSIVRGIQLWPQTYRSSFSK